MIEYEKYYQKGGSYLIPTEIFDELLEENQELKKVVELYSKSLYNAELTKYKEVINKAIEYLETKTIREKALVDVDVLEGILKEVE